MDHSSRSARSFSAFRARHRNQYSSSRHAQNNNAPIPYEHLGSAILLPGSEALPPALHIRINSTSSILGSLEPADIPTGQFHEAAPHSLVDSITSSIRDQRSQQEEDTTLPNPQLPYDLFSESSEIRAGLLYSQQVTAPNSIHPLDSRAHADFYARYWPEYVQGVVPFLDLNDERVASSMIYFGITDSPRAGLASPSRGRVVYAESGGNHDGTRNRAVEERGFTIGSQIQFPPDTGEGPDLYHYYGNQAPGGQWANPYNENFAQGYGAQTTYYGNQVPDYQQANPYLGGSTQNYGAQTTSQGYLGWHQPDLRATHRPRNLSYGPRNIGPSNQSTNHGFWNPSYNAGNNPYLRSFMARHPNHGTRQAPPRSNRGRGNRSRETKGGKGGGGKGNGRKTNGRKNRDKN